MNALAIIQLVLVLLRGVLTAANQQGATKIAEVAQAAIDKLMEVHGSEVTKGQLDALRVEPKW